MGESINVGGALSFGVADDVGDTESATIGGVELREEQLAAAEAVRKASSSCKRIDGNRYSTRGEQTSNGVVTPPTRS